MLEQAQIDGMTGLYTRDNLMPFLQKVLYDTRLHAKTLTFVLFDLDSFKKINDKYGHTFGDKILKDASSILRSILQEYGHAFRYGGDEFAVVFLDKTPEEIFDLIERSRRAISSNMFIFKDRMFHITISCGIAGFYGNEEISVDDLIKRADDALYISKRYGGNLVTDAGRVRYIKIRNTAALAALITALIIAGLVFNTYVFKGFIQNIVTRIKTSGLSGNVDTIILKNGSIIRGTILRELEDKLIISIGSKEGKAEFVVDKSEIADTIYAAPLRNFKLKK